MEKNKLILVTGSTDGIGKQTALELAEKGHSVIIHGRNKEKCLSTIEEIKAKVRSSNLDFVIADFSNKENVKLMADELRSKYSKLDVLINNAGVYLKNRQTNDDGIELTFMINHLAHFYLTLLLIDLLKKSDNARIINVSSIAHENANFNFEDLMFQKGYSGYKAYANSKLFNLFFTYSLQRRLKNSNIKVYALHPGVITTKLLYTGFGISGSPLSIGAGTPVYLATSDEILNDSGKYFVKKRPAKSSKISYDEKFQEKLWDISLALLNLKKEDVEKIFSN